MNIVGAFRWWQLPVEGIGLARMEFIINNVIQIHPMALVRFDELEDDEAGRSSSRQQITRIYVMVEVPSHIAMEGVHRALRRLRDWQPRFDAACAGRYRSTQAARFE